MATTKQLPCPCCKGHGYMTLAVTRVTHVCPVCDGFGTAGADKIKDYLDYINTPMFVNGRRIN